MPDVLIPFHALLERSRDHTLPLLRDPPANITILFVSYNIAVLPRRAGRAGDVPDIDRETKQERESVIS